ncbi:hypothetical protein [Bacillus suaedae]|uniref:Uncharacterized protein n=1 Tax=Halalkalibacter suaedae TaxID=2822140 RepID=A0A940WRG4_9BACI|nr:hypothetical protein [Bacillus suaedae]MBP3951140.1 hypothetical protein [Bacillus suaedae]
MFSKAFIHSIKDRLVGRFVEAEDFSITYRKGEDETVMLNISYTYKEDIFFRFKSTSTLEFDITYSPGEVYETEQYSNIDEVSALLKEIKTWIGNVDKEIQSSPEMRRAEENKRHIDEITNKLSSYQDETEFTNSEVEELKNKLDQLEKSLIEKIQNDIEKEGDFNSEISSLKRDISKLKLQSEHLTKKNWLLLFGTKTYMWTQKHPKLATLLGTTAYNYLPDDIKERMPTEFVQVLLPKLNQTDPEN